MTNGEEKCRTVDGAYALAVEMLDRGEPAAAVEQKLTEMGVSAEAAKSIVASHTTATTQVQRADGKTEMMTGAVVAAGGLAVLLLTSGTIVGSLGTILGGIQAFRGWRMSRGPGG
jgi:hypothetical protein